MIASTLHELRVPVASLKPYPGNPRRGNLQTIVQSLRHHGQYRPIVVRSGTREVLAGNHTLMAAKELGWTEIAATFVDVDDDAAKQIVLIDNRANDLATYDYGALTDLLQSLPDLEGTGYDDDDLEELLNGLASTDWDTGRDTEPGEPPAEPTAKAGDLYVLGEHRLLCGDATVKADVDRLVGGRTLAVMATDPPYGVDLDLTWRGEVSAPLGENRQGRVPNDDRSDWGAAWALADVPVVYVWHGALHASEVQDALTSNDFEVRSQIIWVKTVAPMSRGAYHWRHEPCWYAVRKGHTASWQAGRDQNTVWEAAPPNQIFAGSDEDHTTHPTQKPLLLFERPIENHTRPGEIVYDPFIGSGTTLIAAENLGRRCLAMEIDPGYCDVTIARWEKHTGRTAELEPA